MAASPPPEPEASLGPAKSVRNFCGSSVFHKSYARVSLGSLHFRHQFMS